MHTCCFPITYVTHSCLTPQQHKVNQLLFLYDSFSHTWKQFWWPWFLPPPLNLFCLINLKLYFISTFTKSFGKLGMEGAVNATAVTLFFSEIVLIKSKLLKCVLRHFENANSVYRDTLGRNWWCLGFWEIQLLVLVIYCLNNWLLSELHFDITRLYIIVWSRNSNLIWFFS